MLEGTAKNIDEILRKLNAFGSLLQVLAVAPQDNSRVKKLVNGVIDRQLTLVEECGRLLGADFSKEIIEEKKNDK